MDSPQQQSSPVNTTTCLSFNKSDFTFVKDFNLIIDLLLTGNNPDAVGKAVAQLEDKFENAKQVLDSLPGLQYTKEQQEDILEKELKVLQHKKTQLESFKHLSSPTSL